VKKTSQPWVATLVRTISGQPDAAEVSAQFERVVAALEAKLPAAARHLAAAREDLLAFTAVPREIWRQVCHPIPRSVSIKNCAAEPTSSGSPDRAAIIRLVGAVLMEQTTNRPAE